MNYKKNIYKILFIPFLIFFGLIILYLLFPKLFFFRGWEFFDTFAYKQNNKLSFKVNESGDASRDFILQRYFKENIITINKFGNRIACYDSKKTKSVLVLGTSQTFGSGQNDDETFPKLLCNHYKDISIYNGARKHGILLNKSKNLYFNKILFIAPERWGFRNYCNTKNINNYLIKDLDDNEFELQKINYINFLWHQIRYLKNYLQNRSEIILDPTTTIFPPDDYIINVKYTLSKDVKYEEINCIKKLDKLFKTNNYDVGFMYFPEKQTVLHNQLTIPLDEETKNFIPNMTNLMVRSNIKTYDTKKCIVNKSKKTISKIYNYHDSHLTFDGTKILFNCLINSDLKRLFN